LDGEYIMVDFLKYRPIYAFISLIIFFVFTGTLIHKYRTTGETFEYSVDFTGGTQMMLSLSKPVNGSTIVRILEKGGWSGVATREFSPTEVLVRIKKFSSDSRSLSDRIKHELESSLQDTSVVISKIESVGSGVGDSLKRKSIESILAVLVVVLLYTWWRLGLLSFGIGVLVSLFHDAIVILAFFLVFGYEISLNVVGAILAVLGYSINDTIVIFAQIRENVRQMPHTSLEHVVNLSINETLRRTLLTSFATCLVVVAMVIFGGQVLRTLSLALLVGIVFGTYSSIAIASPVMLMLNKDKKRSH
jgi:preprotein translocase subunit SecF